MSKKKPSNKIIQNEPKEQTIKLEESLKTEQEDMRRTSRYSQAVGHRMSLAGKLTDYTKDLEKFMKD